MDPRKDITEQSFQMPRDSALLYPNLNPKDENSCHFRGIMKTKDGFSYWICAWEASVKGKNVIKIILVPKSK